VSDLALEYSLTNLAFDLALEANDLRREGGMRTAVLLSLFLDRQAEPGDVLPEGGTDRRGWWADAFPVAAGDKIGSRLWLLERATNTRATLDRAEEYAREALAWFITDGVATAVDVAASFLGAGWQLEVTLHRPTSDPVRFRFDRAWSAEVN
jgi:phage gp46-like protein